MVHKRLAAAYAKDAAEFGRKVRLAREAKGWSRDQLVAATGHEIDQKTLQRVEQGYGFDEQKSPTNPELRVLIELCKALGGRVVIDVNRPNGFTVEFVASPETPP